jgi:hypothetical protein
LADARIAAAYRPDDGGRFIVNDKGFTSIEAPNGRKGVIFPLSGAVALVCVIGVGRYPGRESPWLWGEVTFTPSGVDLINEASWRQPGISCVIAHPSDKERLLRLDTERELTVPALGPYRQRGVEDLFDWAYRGKQLT